MAIARSTDCTLAPLRSAKLVTPPAHTHLSLSCFLIRNNVADYETIIHSLIRLSNQPLSGLRRTVTIPQRQAKALSRDERGLETISSTTTPDSDPDAIRGGAKRDSLI
jgi:hypothetical protein